MQRTAIYMRVSTAGQAQDGDSLDAQREALLSYINARSDLVLCGEYCDDGISGQKWEERDALQRLLDDVTADRVDLILVTKMDRLHRSLKNFLQMQDILAAHGVKWVAIWEPMYDTTSPSGQLILNQLMAFAQFEAQNTGQRIRAVQDYKTQRGEVISGKVLPGYVIKEKHLAIDESIAGSIKEAFRFFSVSGNLQKTLFHCADLPGLPTTSRSLKRLLMNRKYIGEFRENVNYCPPIIDRELFEDVQHKLTINIKSSQIYPYLFSGLLICKGCGRKMKGYRSTSHGRYYAYYRCLTYKNGMIDCGWPSVPEAKLEAYLLESIRPALEGYVLECEEKAAPVRDAQKQAAKVQRKIDRLKELYLAELIGLDEYKRDKEALLKELESLKTAAAPPVHDISALKALLSEDITAIYATMTAEQKRFLWRSIIKEIRFDRERNPEIVFL